MHEVFYGIFNKFPLSLRLRWGLNISISSTETEYITLLL